MNSVLSGLITQLAENGAAWSMVGLMSVLYWAERKKSARLSDICIQLSKDSIKTNTEMMLTTRESDSEIKRRLASLEESSKESRKSMSHIENSLDVLRRP